MSHCGAFQGSISVITVEGNVVNDKRLGFSIFLQTPYGRSACLGLEILLNFIRELPKSDIKNLKFTDFRFLGPSLDITTDSGDIRVASCYSDQSKFSTNTGSLFLRLVSLLSLLVLIITCCRLFF